ALKNSSVFDENFRIQVDDDIKTINIKAFPDINNEDNITQWHGVVNDITNSLSLTRENQDLKELLFSLNRNLSESIFRSSEEGGLLFANEAYMELFGFKDMAEAQKQQFAIPYVDNEVRKELFRKLKTTGFFENEEARFRRTDGTTFYGLVSAYIASYQNNKAIIDGSIRDITKIKEVEEELRQAKIKADKANKAKTDFLSTMSHEIRTPLNAIIGVSQILAGKKLDPEVEDNISVIYNSGNILLNLINDILDFSKIEAGHLQLEQTEFNLRRLITDIHKTLGFLKGDKKVSLLYYIDEQINDFYRGDPGRLSQILLNLSNNAVKFTSEGEVRINVHLSERKEQQDIILIEVMDTGIGISESAQKNIFKSFTQAEAGTTRKYGGTGLGLSIVKKLTRLFGGTVSVESKLGEGSTFRVKLPLAHASEVGELSFLDQQVKDLHGVRLLIAEDNQVNGMVVTRLLTQWGA
ncbi:MAG: ATP-binding protein, partial [Owenweeksia sp.]